MIPTIPSTTNRTGVAQDPDLAKEMMKGSKATIDGTQPEDFLAYRAAEPWDGAPVATMPPPANPSLGTAPILLDKLGERLAFERAGVRLYQTLVLKHEVQGTFEGGPTRAELEAICDDELSHFAMLEQVIGMLGGDPTAVTPGANLVANETRGIVATVLDPRTTLAEALHAMLTAELADHAGWEQLVELLEALGQHGVVERFEEAMAQELAHVEQVRGWLTAAAQLGVMQQTV